MKIPITKPFFGEEEKRSILETIDSGWVVQGPKVAEFERLFAAYTGARYALATSSGTTALHLALIALGIGPGDEVVVPSFTWVATANVVEMARARPVLADIDLRTFNVDVQNMERAITPRTKLLMPVSLFGASAPMKEIIDLGEKNGIAVVEDDACATGTQYEGEHAGRRAIIGCFSFHPRKSITTGEGGMLITQDETIAAHVESLRDHGASKSDFERHQGKGSYILPEFNIVGYNYRMTDVQGALGIAQMKRLNWILDQRTRIARRYTEAFQNTQWLLPQTVQPESRHGYQAYVCLFHPEVPNFGNIERLHARRNAWMDTLEAAGIATRPGTHAIHLLGYYRNKYEYASDDFPNAYFADQLSVTLPLYAQMTEAEQEYVIETINNSNP